MLNIGGILTDLLVLENFGGIQKKSVMSISCFYFKIVERKVEGK